MDIITELSGIDSKYRRSAKAAAAEILHQGETLYNMVLDRALSSSGPLADRCAEACSRAARKNPSLAEANMAKIISAIKAKSGKRIRYFLAEALIYMKPSKKQARDCAGIIKDWLEQETGKGPRAAYLEAIAAMAVIEPKLHDMADCLLNEALSSSVASYAARARQILRGGTGLRSQVSSPKKNLIPHPDSRSLSLKDEDGEGG